MTNASRGGPPAKTDTEDVPATPPTFDPDQYRLDRSGTIALMREVIYEEMRAGGEHPADRERLMRMLGVLHEALTRERLPAAAYKLDYPTGPR
jgi:hypothetical protein